MVDAGSTHTSCRSTRRVFTIETLFFLFFFPSRLWNFPSIKLNTLSQKQKSQKHCSPCNSRAFLFEKNFSIFFLFCTIIFFYIMKTLKRNWKTQKKVNMTKLVIFIVINTMIFFCYFFRLLLYIHIFISISYL